MKKEFLELYAQFKFWIEENPTLTASEGYSYHSLSSFADWLGKYHEEKCLTSESNPD